MHLITIMGVNCHSFINDGFLCPDCRKNQQNHYSVRTEGTGRAGAKSCFWRCNNERCDQIFDYERSKKFLVGGVL